jgi:hypothetical protein
MRATPVVVVFLLAALAGQGTASAVVVVRHPVYRPVVRPVAAVATVAVVAAVVSKPPATPPPPPSAPRPPAVTTPLPMDSTMWQLPSSCLKIAVQGEPLYQCGPSWLKQQQSDQGPYYQVVPPPAAP